MGMHPDLSILIFHQYFVMFPQKPHRAMANNTPENIPTQIPSGTVAKTRVKVVQKQTPSKFAVKPAVGAK